MHKYIVTSLTELQETPEDSSVTLSQRAYIIAKSLSELKASALGLLLLLLVFLSGVTVNIYVPPIDIDKAKEAAFLGTVVSSVGIIWYYIKGRQLDRNLNDWKEDHLEQAYYLVFDTTIPKGDTTGEKILNLALAVFPELRSNYIPPGIQDRIILYFKRKLGKSKRTIVSESMNYKVSSDYSVDLALRIPDGYFIVKDFKDKVVSFEDLKYLVKILSRKFREIGLPPRRVNIFRLICVAQEYDQYFLERETLENKMRELKTDFGVDLLIQDKVGYSVLWVG
jgi:hypothetical protein